MQLASLARRAKWCVGAARPSPHTFAELAHPQRCGAEKPICENCKIRSRACSYPSTTNASTPLTATPRAPPVQRSTPGPSEPFLPRFGGSSSSPAARTPASRPSASHSPYTVAHTPAHAPTPAGKPAQTPVVPSSTPASIHPSHLSTPPSGAVVTQSQSHPDSRRAQPTPAQVTPIAQSPTYPEPFTNGDSALVGPDTVAIMGAFVPTSWAFEDGAAEQIMPSLEGVDLSWLFLPELMGAPPEPRLDGLSVQEHW